MNLFPYVFSDIDTSCPIMTGGGGTVAGIWGQWAQWTTCVVSCQGQRTRLRSCNAIRNLPGTVTCPGDSLQTGNCSDDSSCDGSGNRELLLIT